MKEKISAQMMRSVIKWSVSQYTSMKNKQRIILSLLLLATGMFDSIIIMANKFWRFLINHWESSSAGVKMTVTLQQDIFNNIKYQYFLNCTYIINNQLSSNPILQQRMFTNRGIFTAYKPVECEASHKKNKVIIENVKEK